MSEHAATLRIMAAELDATATSAAQQARMADGNAHQANLPPRLAQTYRDTAARHRDTVTFAEARAKACLAGAAAIENTTAPSPL